MNRTTMITALACGLFLTAGAAAPALAPDSADGTSRSTDDLAGPGGADTLLINGRAFTLE